MYRFKLFFFLSTLHQLTFGQIQVGIITDLEETSQSQLLIEALIQEMDQTTGVSRRIQSSDRLQFFDISTTEEAQRIYQDLNADLILSIGGISTKGISGLSRLPIPVIGLGVVDPSIQSIPFRDGTSGKSQFTYIRSSRDLKKEIASFQKLTGFDQLSLIIDPAIYKTIHESGQVLIDSIEAELGISVQLIEAVRDVQVVLSQVETAEAVYLSGVISRDQAYVRTISDFLIENRIVSFSSSSQYVEFGILASSSGDNGNEQILRRVGVIADDILSGRNAAEIPVAMQASERFSLNIETAERLDFSVPFEILLTANIVGERRTEDRVYSFSEIANLALEQNLDLKISYQDIDVAALDVRTNRSNLLPSVSSGITGTRINEERANASVNSPESSLNLDLTLTQVLYSEEALAAIKISQYLKSAQEYQTQVDVLNVLLDTYNAYLDVLAAKTNLMLQRENLDNTRTNLELASIRVNLGSSTSADLYRWESELANATQSLVEAQAGLIALKLQLNNLLANSLEDDYTIKDISMDDDLFSSFKNGPLSGLIFTPKDLKVASDFLVQESIARNPNKKQLLENIKASERQLALNKRLLYVPTVAFQAQTTEVLARGGVGSENPPSDPSVPSFGTGLQDNTWSAGINLSYPIFSGFSRRINKQRSQVQLAQLNQSNTSLDQGLELSIRASTVSLLSATTNLGYSQKSAESASQNFQLIQSNYRAGNVNITQVIDAQQAALAAQLAAAISVYEFMAANLQIEYALGFFSMFLTEEELTDFRARFLSYVSDQ